MNLGNIDYQDVIDLYAQLLAVAMPIGLIWGLLDRLVIMFFDAVLDRWRKRGSM